jgi:hypothetical protein
MERITIGGKEGKVEKKKTPAESGREFLEEKKESRKKNLQDGVFLFPKVYLLCFPACSVLV